MSNPTAYQSLVDHQRDIALLGSTQAVLGWDQETQMPNDAVLTRLTHQMQTDPRIGDWLDAAGNGDTDADQACNISYWRKSWDRATRMPEDLAVALSEASSVAMASWQQARATDSFPEFAPHHPFCTSLGAGDVRMTMRSDEDTLLSALGSSMHECGHALYEQGLPRVFAGQPRGAYNGLSIHESQSRLWENHVGRSKPFWEWFTGQIADEFALPGLDAEQLYRAVNRTEAGLIRVEADQATYDLHIMVRFELERALLNGDLKPSELPDAWNAHYRDYLGVTPDSNATGWGCTIARLSAPGLNDYHYRLNTRRAVWLPDLFTLPTAPAPADRVSPSPSPGASRRRVH